MELTQHNALTAFAQKMWVKKNKVEGVNDRNYLVGHVAVFTITDPRKKGFLLIFPNNLNPRKEFRDAGIGITVKDAKKAIASFFTYRETVEL